MIYFGNCENLTHVCYHLLISIGRFTGFHTWNKTRWLKYCIEQHSNGQTYFWCHFFRLTFKVKIKVNDDSQNLAAKPYIVDTKLRSLTICCNLMAKSYLVNMHTCAKNRASRFNCFIIIVKVVKFEKFNLEYDVQGYSRFNWNLTA